jgi:hypothetical protein
MRRFELTPSRCLRDQVQCIWALDGVSLGPADEAIFPDPYRELVLGCTTSLLLERAPGVFLVVPSVVLNDLQATPLVLRTRQPGCVVGLRLFPWADLAALGPRQRLHGTSLWSLPPVWLARARQLACTVVHAGVEAAMHALDAYLCAHYCAPRGDALVVALVRDLLTSPRRPRRRCILPRSGHSGCTCEAPDLAWPESLATCMIAAVANSGCTAFPRRWRHLADSWMDCHCKRR